MIALQTFNQLSHEEALAQLQPCVALPDWADALVQGRPYSHRKALFDAARALAQNWDETALTQALNAHPRIGEKPTAPGRRRCFRARSRAPSTTATGSWHRHCRKGTLATRPVLDACF